MASRRPLSSCNKRGFKLTHYPIYYDDCGAKSKASGRHPRRELSLRQSAPSGNETASSDFGESDVQHISQGAGSSAEHPMLAEKEGLVVPQPPVQLPGLGNGQVQGIEEMAHRHFQYLGDLRLRRAPGIGRGQRVNQADKTGDEDLAVAGPEVVDPAEDLYPTGIEPDLFEAFAQGCCQQILISALSSSSREGDLALVHCHQRRALREDNVQLAAELVEGNEDGGAEGPVVRGDRPVAVAPDAVPNTVD